MTDGPERSNPKDLIPTVGDSAEPSFVSDPDGRVVVLKDQAGELVGVGPSVAYVTKRTRTPGGSPRKARPPGHLTQREWQVLRLLAAGFTAREVAESLGIAYSTARNHAQHILEKLGAPNRVAALLRVLDVMGFAALDEWLADQSTPGGDSSHPVTEASSSRVR